MKWKILNTQLDGEIDYFNNMTYGDILNIVKKLTGYYDLQNIIVNNLSKNTTDLVSKDDEITFISESVQVQFRDLWDICNYKINIVPDHKKYDLGIAKFNIYRKKHDNTIEKILLTSIFKIILETEINYLVKFFRPYQINWGSGPIIPSIYAFFNKKNFYIYPVFLESKDFEKFVNSYKIKEDFQYTDNKWENFTQETCPICLDNINEYYAYCQDYHLIACESCVSKIKKCPICKSSIVVYNKVKFL